MSPEGQNLLLKPIMQHLIIFIMLLNTLQKSFHHPQLSRRGRRAPDVEPYCGGRGRRRCPERGCPSEIQTIQLFEIPSSTAMLRMPLHNASLPQVSQEFGGWDDIYTIHFAAVFVE